MKWLLCAGPVFILTLAVFIVQATACDRGGGIQSGPADSGTQSAAAAPRLLTGPGSWAYDMMLMQGMRQALLQRQAAISAQKVRQNQERLARQRAVAQQRRSAELARREQRKSIALAMANQR